MPHKETINKRNLHVFDSTHSIYKLQYASRPYQAMESELLSLNPLPRRKFEFRSGKKILWKIEQQYNGTENLKVTVLRQYNFIKHNYRFCLNFIKLKYISITSVVTK